MNFRRLSVKKLSRREFFKKTGKTALVAGVMASGIMGSVTDAEAKQKLPNWDEEFDVIIVGSGFAGLSAAIEASNNGASVAIIEKMPMPGGNSTINGGGFAAVGSSLQKKLGIKDSPEMLYKDMLKAGLGINYPTHAKIVAEKSGESFEWLKDYIGIEFKDTIAQFGGHSVPRTHTTLTQSGSAIVRPMLSKAKELGAKLKTKTIFCNFYFDDSNKVVGMKVKEGFRYKNGKYKKIKNIKAKKGIIMASGGFSADIPFRKIQDPRLTSSINTTNQPGATSECIIEMLTNNATPVQLSWIQLGPWASPDEKGFGLAPIFAAYAAFPYGVIVDPKTGKRFVNELADRKVRADAMLKLDHYCISFCDSDGMQNSKHVMEKLLKRKVVIKFDTLKELADHYNVPFTELKAQVERYNSYVDKGKDLEFKKPFMMKKIAIKKAPFYCAKYWPKVHHCMGGVRTSEKAEVIDIRTEKPIKGLYAAGELSGGTHGACRLGTCAIPDCIIFGRIAGENIVKQG